MNLREHDLNCEHFGKNCKLVETKKVTPNGFNIREDSVSPHWCHVLQPPRLSLSETVSRILPHLQHGISSLEKDGLNACLFRDIHKSLKVAIYDESKNQESLVLEIKSAINMLEMDGVQNSDQCAELLRKLIDKEG